MNSEKRTVWRYLNNAFVIIAVVIVFIPNATMTHVVASLVFGDVCAIIDACKLKKDNSFNIFLLVLGVVGVIVGILREIGIIKLY